jgi:hypothetical protein
MLTPTLMMMTSFAKGSMSGWNPERDDIWLVSFMEVVRLALELTCDLD